MSVGVWGDSFELRCGGSDLTGSFAVRTGDNPPPWRGGFAITFFFFFGPREEAGIKKDVGLSRSKRVSVYGLLDIALSATGAPLLSKVAVEML